VNQLECRFASSVQRNEVVFSAWRFLNLVGEPVLAQIVLGSAAPAICSPTLSATATSQWRVETATAVVLKVLSS
jgi:hypothetical protein